jgi:hypothetical protein
MPALCSSEAQQLVAVDWVLLGMGFIGRPFPQRICQNSIPQDLIM